MESVASIVTALFSSPILYVASLVVVLLLIFTGKIKVSGKYVSLNASDNERSIIRNQIEYARCFCLGLHRYINDTNKYREIAVIEQIYNEVINMISFNHLRTEDDYIMTKQEKLWNIASTYAEDFDFYQSDDFRTIIFERTKKLINELVRIRKLNTRGV